MPAPNASRLDCPRCGYNVGPTSDWRPGQWSSCPECGERYDATHLERLAQLNRGKPPAKPINIILVLFHLFWPALAVLLILFVSLPISGNMLRPMLSVVLLAIIALNLYVGHRIASRRTPTYSVWHTPRTIAIALLLSLAQAGLMFFAVIGGCAYVLRDIQGI